MRKKLTDLGQEIAEDLIKRGFNCGGGASQSFYGTYKPNEICLMIQFQSIKNYHHFEAEISYNVNLTATIFHWQQVDSLEEFLNLFRKNTFIQEHFPDLFK